VLLLPLLLPEPPEPLLLPFPLPLSLPLHLSLPLSPMLGVGAGGKGPPEDSVVPTEVGMVATVAAAEGANLLSAWSRTQRPAPRPPSCPA
jgi:hypothetical protein